MKTLRILLMILMTSTGLLLAQTNTLDSLISNAIRVSPKLKMLQAKVDASRNRIEENSNLPDPMLTLGLMNLPTNSFSFNQEPMTGKVIGLSQSFPFPGKLSAVADVANSDVGIVKEGYDDSKNEIKKNISQAYYNLLFIRKSISIMLESKKLLQNIAQVVRTKYSVSTASQQNLLKIELEITNVNDQLDDLNSKEHEQLSILNSYLLRNPDTNIETQEIANIEFLNISKDELDSIAVKNRPFLKGIMLAVEKAKLQENLAKYGHYPNFNLSVQYSQRDILAKTNMDQPDFFSVMVGISLPLNYGGKVTSKIDEAISMQELYQQQYSSALQTLNSSFGTSIAKLNSLEERIKLTSTGLLPQANQNLTSALSSYQVGQIDFLNVIDAQNRLYQIETNLAKLKYEYLKQAANLEFLVGCSLTKEFNKIGK